MLDEADAQEADAQEAPKGGARCLSPRALSGSSVCVISEVDNKVSKLGR
jgi:hypothetical protein